MSSANNTVENIIESERCESPLYKTEEEYNTAVIYHNDLIMKNIVAHIPEFENRMKMKYVSKHLRNVVDKAEYVTPFVDKTEDPDEPSCDEFYIGCPSNHQFVEVLMGSFQKGYNTWRRGVPVNIEDEPKQLRPYIMETLVGALFARKNVQTVTIGKRESKMSRWMLAKFIVTKDLLMHMENFVNLHTVQIHDAAFNQEAQDYILSDECEFKNWIETLKLKKVNRGPWQSAMINKHLKHLELMDLVGLDKMAEKMEKLNVMLDTIRVQLFECDNITEAVDSMSRIARYSKKIVMELKDEMPIAFGHALKYWPNVTSLRLKLRSFVGVEDLQFNELFESVGKLRNLEKLELFGSDLMPKWIGLAKAIQPMKHLKELFIEFRGMDQKTEQKDLKEFLKFLPHSIETMEMSFCWREAWEDDLVDSFTTQFANTWKNLIFGIRGLGSKLDAWVEGKNEKLFQKIVTKMNLTKLDFCPQICQEEVLQCILDHKQLDEVQLFISHEIAPNFERVMRDHFENYESDRKSQGEQIKASKRKPGTLKFVD